MSCHSVLTFYQTNSGNITKQDFSKCHKAAEEVSKTIILNNNVSRIPFVALL